MALEIVPCVEVNSQANFDDYKVAGGLARFVSYFQVKRLVATTHLPNADHVYPLFERLQKDTGVQIIPELEFVAADMGMLQDYSYWRQLGAIAAKWIYRFDSPILGIDAEALMRKFVHEHDPLYTPEQVGELAAWVSNGARTIYAPEVWLWPGVGGGTPHVVNEQKMFVRGFACGHSGFTIACRQRFSSPAAFLQYTSSTDSTLRDLDDWCGNNADGQIDRVFCCIDPPGRAHDAEPRYWTMRELSNTVFPLLESQGVETVQLYPGANRWEFAAIHMDRGRQMREFITGD